MSSQQNFTLVPGNKNKIAWTGEWKAAHGLSPQELSAECLFACGDVCVQLSMVIKTSNTSPEKLAHYCEMS